MKAFQTIVCRIPTSEEKELIESYFEEEKTIFAGQPLKVKNIISTGEFKHEPIEDVVALASLIQTVQMIYNLDETISRS